MRLSQGRVREKRIAVVARDEPELIRVGPPTRTLVFAVPMPLNIANARLHWRVKQNAKKAYYQTLDAMQAAKQLPPPPAQPFGPSRIWSTMVLGGRMDNDNAMARHKWPLDWLQTRGYVANDRDLDWPDKPTQHVSRRDPSRLFLTITENPEPSSP